MPCPVMSRPLTSSHFISSRVMLGPVLSCPVLTCHGMSCHVMSCYPFSGHIISYSVRSVRLSYFRSCLAVAVVRVDVIVVGSVLHISVITSSSPGLCSHKLLRVRVPLPSLHRGAILSPRPQQHPVRALPTTVSPSCPMLFMDMTLVRVIESSSDATDQQPLCRAGRSSAPDPPQWSCQLGGGPRSPTLSTLDHTEFTTWLKCVKW